MLRFVVRVALALVIAAAAAAQQPDGREIMRRSARANDENWKLARNYTFLERVEQQQLDSAGQVKSKSVKTYDVTLLDGSPYRRLVEREDRALSPEEQKKEEERLQKSLAQRSKETAGERQRRIDEWEKRRERDRQTMLEVSEAFDFRITGDERVDGREVVVLEATPRQGYHPQSRTAKLLPHFRGRLWIDRQNYQWVKVEAQAIDTVTWGLFLIRLDPGARLSFEQSLVRNEVWLPRQVLVTGSARIGLFKRLRLREEVTYKNYRKFQTDSRLVSP